MLANADLRISFVQAANSAGSPDDDKLQLLPALELSWLTPETAVSAATDTVAVHGNIAPFGSTHERLQLLSINGMPVHSSTVLDFVLRVHQSMSAGRKLRPTKQLHHAAAMFVLRLSMPESRVFFSGTALQRTAQVDMEQDVEALLSQVLLQAWHADMPAVVLSSLQRSAATGRNIHITVTSTEAGLPCVALRNTSNAKLEHAGAQHRTDTARLVQQASCALRRHRHASAPAVAQARCAAVQTFPNMNKHTCRSSCLPH